MKVAAITIVALMAMLGVTLAQYAYPGYYGAGQGTGSAAYLGLGLMMFLLFFFLLNQPKSVPLYVGNISTGVNVLAG